MSSWEVWFVSASGMCGTPAEQRLEKIYLGSKRNQFAIDLWSIYHLILLTAAAFAFPQVGKMSLLYQSGTGSVVWPLGVFFYTNRF